MATQKSTARAGEASEMEAAAELILQREEARKRRARRRAKQRQRERRQEAREATQRMQQSIEVIKACVVAICSVWVISFLISVYVLIEVQSKVTEIEGQVDRIRHVIDNPFSSAGARLGGQVDAKIREFLGVPAEKPDAP